MRLPHGIGAVVLILCFACTSLKLNAQTETDPGKAELTRRLEALEKEVGELRAALARAYAPNADAPDAASALVTSTPPAPQSTSLSRLLGSTRLSGLVDVDLGHNFNQPATRMSGLRAFDAPANQFSLNMVELVVDKPAEATTSRLGYHVGLGFGETMDVVNSANPSGPLFAQYLKEGYFSYLAPVGSGLTVDVGKFVTPSGAEVIESKDDWNYSRGLLFTYAIPYYHFGVRMKYAISSKYSVTGYVVNGWNNVVDNNSGKTLGVSFGWKPTKKISVSQNYMVGPEGCDRSGYWRHLSDTVISYAPTNRLSLMLNYDYGHDYAGTSGAPPVFWTGVAGYVRYVLNPQYSVAGRYEYYDDHDGFTTGTPQHLNEITGTFERITARHLITRLEFRRDVSSAPVFLKGRTPVAGQTTVAAGMVYAFDTREQK